MARANPSRHALLFHPLSRGPSLSRVSLPFPCARGREKERRRSETHPYAATVDKQAPNKTREQPLARQSITRLSSTGYLEGLAIESTVFRSNFSIASSNANNLAYLAVNAAHSSTISPRSFNISRGSLLFSALACSRLALFALNRATRNVRIAGTELFQTRAEVVDPRFVSCEPVALPRVRLRMRVSALSLRRGHASRSRTAAARDIAGIKVQMCRSGAPSLAFQKGKMYHATTRNANRRPSRTA